MSEPTYLEPVTCGTCGSTGTFLRDTVAFVECRICGSDPQRSDFELDPLEDDGFEFVDDVLHVRFYR